MKMTLDLPSRLVAGLMAFLTLWTGFAQAAPPWTVVINEPRDASPPGLSDPVSPGDAPPMFSEPAPTPPTNAPPDRFVEAKLAEIGPGVSSAFVFVRDRIGFEAYTGSLRGARGTLWSEAGNSLDKSTLLIELLSAQGIEARYARGTLSTSNAQTLIHSMFDPVVAANAVGYIPERYTLADPVNDTNLLAQVREHWWVELTNGTALDPSFQGAAIGSIRGTKTATHADAPAEQRHKVVVRLKAEFNQMLLGLNETTPMEVTFTTAEIDGRALTLGHFINAYQPPAMFGGFKSYTYSPSRAPGGRR